MSEQAAVKTEEQPDVSEQSPRLDQQGIDFLNQELDRLLGLYSEAQSNVQSVFNFYLTFVTTIVGALVVLLQISPQFTTDSTSVQLTVIGLLLFVGIVGLIYLSALSGRYAHAGRFAHAIDEIRYYLMQQLNVLMPNVYNTFWAEGTNTSQPAKTTLLIWLSPTGTYQMFIAIVNSAALAALIWQIFALGNADFGRLFGGSLIVFIIALIVNIVYSRIVINHYPERLHVRIDIEHELPMWSTQI